MVCCVYRRLRFAIRHLPILAAAVRGRPTYTLDGKVRTVWCEYRYFNCPYISEVLWFLAEPHPRNLDIRLHCHAQSTNNVITQPINSSTSSNGPHHARVVGPRCNAMATVVLYRRLWFVICHHHLSLFCCAVVLVFAVCCARREKQHQAVCIYGTVIVRGKWSRYPILDLIARAPSS